MTETLFKSSGEFSELSPRYLEIERNNERSWYTQGARSFETYQSLGTIKPSVRGLAHVALGFRRTNAGNMSPSYGEGTKEQNAQAALDNMLRFYATLKRDPSTGMAPHHLRETKMLYPQRPRIERKPLQMINVDDYDNEPDALGPLVLPERADFLYTYNPGTILAARPADCPIVLASADTPQGRIMTLTHFSWEVAADGAMDTMFDHYDELAIDRESLQIYVTPGGHADSFPYTNFPDDPRAKYPRSDSLFVDVRPSEADPSRYDFEVDTPYFVYQELLAHGIAPEQIYADTSDTSDLASGYSSHGRADRSSRVWGKEAQAPGREENIRDMIIAKMNKIVLNPERPAPQEVIEKIKPVHVTYLDLGGATREGTIEVHEEVAQDVAAFFGLAYELKFPIDRVVRSSEPEFGWDDDKLMDANTSSGFNYRLIKGTDRPSLHGLGRAFDVNCRLNPYIRHEYEDHEDGSVTVTDFVDPEGAVYDPNAPGTLTADHPLVQLMRDRGWEWGGDWKAGDSNSDGSRVRATDYQHFEKEA